MAERSSRISVKRKDTKKAENRPQEEKEKEKEKVVKKPDKLGKKPEKKSPEQPETETEEKVGGDERTAGGAEGEVKEESREFQPIELPPFEIVTGVQMSPFYFKFQFRNVEYSSGRNKTLLCFRVDTAGGSTEPLKGYMEDEHATAHAEEAFFQQVLSKSHSSQELEVTWYVSSSPCVACATKVAAILQQRKKLRLCIFCSRLIGWEEQEMADGLRTLVSAGCKLRMMNPSDFVHVWETYVEKEEEEEHFTPWEDCQDNYEYYVERLAAILK